MTDEPKCLEASHALKFVCSHAKTTLVRMLFFCSHALGDTAEFWHTLAWRPWWPTFGRSPKQQIHCSYIDDVRCTFMRAPHTPDRSLRDGFTIVNRATPRWLARCDPVNFSSLTAVCRCSVLVYCREHETALYCVSIQYVQLTSEVKR